MCWDSILVGAPPNASNLKSNFGVIRNYCVELQNNLEPPKLRVWRETRKRKPSGERTL